MKPNKDRHSVDQTEHERKLCRAILNLQSINECDAFLKDLCTPAELQALVDRWQVVMLLKEEHSYRRINELTGVSVTTIGRVARFLSDGFGGYEAALTNRKPRTGK